VTAARSVVCNVVMCGDAIVGDRKSCLLPADHVKPGTKECETVETICPLYDH
jgi:hypothetical protein